MTLNRKESDIVTNVEIDKYLILLSKVFHPVITLGIKDEFIY